MKDYLLRLLTECAPENGFAQDAIEWAIFENRIRLSYTLEADKHRIMQQYDTIIANYRAVQAHTASVDRVLELL